MTKIEVEYKRGQYRYRLHFVLKDGFVESLRVYADSQKELEREAKRVLEDICDYDGRSAEVDRVYSTRIDCPIEPERVRQAA